MTKHAWVKKKIVADNDGAADCSCNEPEAQWHIMGIPAAATQRYGSDTLECVKN
jgi:hypothetical protein